VDDGVEINKNGDLSPFKKAMIELLHFYPAYLNFHAVLCCRAFFISQLIYTLFHRCLALAILQHKATFRRAIYDPADL
jgi:hypothetical protein